MIEDLEKKLKAPFPVENLHWRMGNLNGKKDKALMLVYVDARDVMDRLDEVCGLNWQDDYKEVNGRIVCTITIDGISKSDGAGDTSFEAEKGGLSDAFKRCAVKWGIGRYLYDASKYNTWVAYSEERKWTLYEDNKEQLDKVARMLSGLEKTPAEKAKETRAENKAEAMETNEICKKTVAWLETLKRELSDVEKDKLLDLASKARVQKASDVRKLIKLLCKFEIDYITPKVDLSLKEKSYTEALIAEVGHYTEDAEVEAIGNVLAKTYNDKDNIAF